MTEKWKYFLYFKVLLFRQGTLSFQDSNNKIKADQYFPMLNQLSKCKFIFSAWARHKLFYVLDPAIADEFDHRTI